MVEQEENFQYNEGEKKQPTHLAAEIEIADQQITYDHYAKRILGNKKILSRILSRVVPEFAGMSFEEIEACIEGEPEVACIPVNPGMTNCKKLKRVNSKTANCEQIKGNATEDAVPNEGIIYYDVRFFVKIPKNGRCIKIIINVEGQRKFSPGYPLVTRGIFYAARMISAQLSQEFGDSDYGQIKKVYSIWVCFSSTLEQANAIAKYKICKNDIIPGIKDDPEAYDKLSVVMLTLSEKMPTEDELLGMLNTLFGKKDFEEKKKILAEKYGLEMEQEFDKEVGIMCNFSGYLIDEGKIEGQAKGTVLACKKYGGTLEEVCELLMEDEELSLSAEEARALAEKFWNN